MMKQKQNSKMLHDQVGVKAKRKLKAKKHGEPGVWFGLGMMGLVGWSISIPTLLGTAFGAWLDSYYDDQRSYTLTFLLAGLVLGCFIAWRWLSKEQTNIGDDT